MIARHVADDELEVYMREESAPVCIQRVTQCAICDKCRSFATMASGP
jgi:hypothetical protein